MDFVWDELKRMLVVSRTVSEGSIYVLMKPGPHQVSQDVLIVFHVAIVDL